MAEDQYFFSFWGLCWVFAAAHQLSLVAVSGGYSLVVVYRRLIVVVSHCAGSRAQARDDRLSSCGAWV